MLQTNLVLVKPYELFQNQWLIQYNTTNFSCISTSSLLLLNPNFILREIVFPFLSPTHVQLCTHCSTILFKAYSKAKVFIFYQKNTAHIIIISLTAFPDATNKLTSATNDSSINCWQTKPWFLFNNQMNKLPFNQST